MIRATFVLTLVFSSTNWLGTTLCKCDIWLRSNEGISWIKKIHPLARLSFYPVMFLVNIFPLKLFIFLNSFHSKSSSRTLFTASKTFDMTGPFIKCIMWQWGNNITVNTHCDITMGRLHCLGNPMISPWGVDIAIDTKQSCDQQLVSFTQDLR